MSLPRFDIKDMLTCAATDEEGFRCVRAPGHDGDHHWGRCDHADPDGHRCFLSPDHPGPHTLRWFDRPTAPGARHVVGYDGSEESCQSRAASDMRIFHRYDWRPVEWQFRPALPWRLRLTAPLLGALVGPRGRMDVEFEYRPPQDHPETETSA